MADKQQEMEWVPRSHLVGAFGTLTRGAQNKKKLFAQLIDEEGEEAEQYKDRGGQETGAVQVALYTCKDARDGEEFVSLIEKIFSHGKTAEGFNGLWELTKGDGLFDSKFLLVQVGTCQSLVDQFSARVDDMQEDFDRVVKRVRSTIFTKCATTQLKEMITKLNSGTHKVFDIGAAKPAKYAKHFYDLVESPNYALPGGWKSVDKYCKAVGDSLVVRYDRITAKSAEGMADIEAALGELYSADHRVTDKPCYRYMSIQQGSYPECKTPLSFIVKVDETHSEILTFDSMVECALDGAYVASSDAFKAANDGVDAIETYMNQGEALHVFKSKAGFNAHKGKKLLRVPDNGAP